MTYKLLIINKKLNFVLKIIKMCGRTCMTLNQDEICKCSKYKIQESDEKKVEPSYRNEYNLGKT